MKPKRISRKYIWITASGLFFLVCILVIAASYIIYSIISQRNKDVVATKPIRNVFELQGLSELWSRDDVFASYNFGDPLVVSSRGIIALKGAINRISYSQLITIDGQTGQTMWDGYPFGLVSSIAGDDTGIIVGTRYGSVIKHDPQTGKVIWSEKISALHRIYPLHVIEDQIYLYSLPGELSILRAQDGKKLDYQLPIPFKDVILVSDDIVYAEGLKVVNSKTGKLIWETGFNDSVYETPHFANDRIFVRTGRFSGHIYSVDRLSGQIFWRSEQEIVSNIVVSDRAIYALSADGEVRCYEGKTGGSKLLARFEPSPIKYIQNNPIIGGYYIAIDKLNRQLYVLLGDTAQLFAFQLLNDDCS